MEEREQENRSEALGHAVRHKIGTERADEVIRSAEKYFKFLQGGDK